ncbi:MAG: arsenate reductase ArsC [Planctomycetaceae bacterium]
MTTPKTLPSVLFLCTGNSCRSQMAEGLLRMLAADRCVSLSAGAKPAGYVHPLAVKAMQEVDCDIATQTSKSIAEFLPPVGQPPDLIISVCSNADRDCPVFPVAVERRHWPFDDPAHAQGSEDERMQAFRRVRDEIGDKLSKFIASGGLASLAPRRA